MNDYEKRITDLTKEIQLRSEKLQLIISQNNAVIEQERNAIQQKIGAVVEIQRLKAEKEANKPEYIVSEAIKESKKEKT